MTVLNRGPAVAEGDPLPPDNVPASSTGEPLDALYNAEKPRLLGLLRRRAGPQDAADHVQQAFVRLAELDASRRSAIASPQGYLRRIVLNLANGAARTARRRDIAAHVPVDDLDLPAPDQIAALEARDMLCRLDAALSRLKPRTREIFLAHRFDGFSYAEISSRTGLSVDTVKWHMSKAIAHIDRVLGPR